MDRREMLLGTATLGLAARLDFSPFLTPLNMKSDGERMPDSTRVSDRELARLRGLVKTVVEGGGRAEYDQKGNRLSWLWTNPDGTQNGDAYTYDSSGRPLTVVARATDGAIVQKAYQYDDNGRLLIITSSDGEQTAVEYDKAGHKTETRVIGKTEERAAAGAIGLALMIADVDGSVTFGYFFAGNASSFKTIYNDQDQPTETRAYGKDGHLLGRLVRTFDHKGRISGTKEVIDDPLSKFPAKGLDQMIAQSGLARDELRAEFAKAFGALRRESGKVYSYDSEGHIEKVIVNSGIIGAITRTYAYNDHGDVTLEHTEIARNAAIPVGVPFHVDEDGKAVPDKPPAESPAPVGLEPPPDTHYSYKYDNQGNWTEKTTTFSNQSSFTSRREITYY